MARDNKGFACHAHDALVSYELHHVWPLGYHGPDVKANLIKICPNSHSDIHWLMELMLRGKPYNLSEFGPAVRKYARSGFEQVIAYADSLAAAIGGPDGQEPEAQSRGTEAHPDLTVHRAPGGSRWCRSGTAGGG